MSNKRCIIIGSGASVRQNLWNTSIENLPIWKAIKDEVTIGLNFSYKWFTSTIQMFADYHFYMAEREKLDKLSLVIGKQDPHIGVKKVNGKFLCEPGKNLYLLPPNKKKMINNKKISYWGKDSWKNGFYDGTLVGIMALTFAIACGFDEIFLLGFDCNATDKKTHFYEGDKEKTGYISIKFPEVHNPNQIRRIEKSGVGIKWNENKKIYEYNTSVYNQNMNEWFKVYIPELERIQIWNVSPNSAITIFPKMTYDAFYQYIKNNPYLISQETMREEIKHLLNTKLKK